MPLRVLLKDYFLIWLALVLMGLFFRPLIPVDETRAVSVAWEMWLRHDFLVPHLNGVPYSHKPPLLQWCIHLLWLVFGASEWAARLVVPLFALGNLVLASKLARRLWPDDLSSPRLAPLFLLAMPVWALWTSLTLYDMLTTFCTLVGLHGLAMAGRGAAYKGWALAGLGIGLGILAKGPAILVMILPLALLPSLWLEKRPDGGYGRWYLGVGSAFLLGAALGLAWALPAGFAGGDEYRRMIFWGQSAGRISNSFAHKRAFWWYFSLLPVLWFPWTLWPPVWRSARSLKLDFGLRFCTVQVLSVLLVFTLISGKQIHYILPIFPAVALFAARMASLGQPAMARLDPMPLALLLILLALALLLLPMPGFHVITGDVLEVAQQAPLMAKLGLLGLGVALLSWRLNSLISGVRAMALVMAGVLFCAHLAYRQAAWRYFDMQPFADRLASIEKEGAPIAYWLKYHGDFNFLGRLQHPLVEVYSLPELQQWMETHPEGHVVLVRQPDPSYNEEGAEYAQYYRGSRRLMLWKSTDLLKRPEALDRLVWQGAPGE